jgi:hypothetical protein
LQGFLSYAGRCKREQELYLEQFTCYEGEKKCVLGDGRVRDCLFKKKQTNNWYVMPIFVQCTLGGSKLNCMFDKLKEEKVDLG